MVYINRNQEKKGVEVRTSCYSRKGREIPVKDGAVKHLCFDIGPPAPVTIVSGKVILNTTLFANDEDKKELLKKLGLKEEP
jgi:hypothetical protein